jgi:N utilization substance protein A
MVAQLLTAEGFASVEELALVPVEELASIEGFDADTATELQNRAKDYLARQEAELESKRKELGVDDALKDVPGVSSRMLVAFGEHGIKSVEDLADCATDDLLGWTERKDGEAVKHEGALEGFEIERADAESLIMQARVKAGWIDESALHPPEAEPEAAEEPQPQA